MRFREYTFDDSLLTLKITKADYAFNRYKELLARKATKVTIEGEPLSAVFTTRGTVKWTTIQEEIGVKVRQQHVGVIRDELKPVVQTWMDQGHPFASGGGIHGSVPTKSLSRVEHLQQFPEYRNIIQRWGVEELALEWADLVIPARIELSKQLLDRMHTDPDALARGNENAGMGIIVQGRRLKRGDTIGMNPKLFEFLIPHMRNMAIAFLVKQLAPIEPDEVIIAIVGDTNIRGAMAYRSDFDAKDIKFDGDRLMIDGIAGTRQVGTDASGALANARTERQILGKSFAQVMLEQFAPLNVKYPFDDHGRYLIDAWQLPPQAPDGQSIVIGEDLGLDIEAGRLKAGADNLFISGYTQLASGIIAPDMLSGTWWTDKIYWIFHKAVSMRAGPALETSLNLGDDMNLKTLAENADTVIEVLEPYVKIKSTRPATGDTKILGWWTRFLKDGKVIHSIVPRVIKTISSASKLGSYWSEKLSDLGTGGQMDLEISEEANLAVTEDMQYILPLYFFEGTRQEYAAYLNDLGPNLPEMVDKLAAYKDFHFDFSTQLPDEEEE
jgi:hypothetical protein